MSAAPLEAHDLYRFYHVGAEEVFALRGIHLAVAAGEFVAITGPSGSGKSTLLACLGGLDEPDGGHVNIAGHRITRRSEKEQAYLRAALIGVMAQSGNLFSHVSVIDNVRLRQSLGPKGKYPRPRSLLDLVGLGNRASAMPGTLSGGEAARAGFAVAISTNPRVLLCDEPTGEVDQLTESTILALLKERQEDGTAIVVATHSVALAGRADRVLHLGDGILT